MAFTSRNPAAEARGVPEIDQLGGKVGRESSLQSKSGQEALRAELIGDTCSAGGVTARGHVPALALCRQLLANGLSPDAALEVFRGTTLALRIRSIAEGAGLTVEETGNGPRFRPYRPHPSAGRPPIEASEPAAVRHRVPPALTGEAAP